MRDKTNWHIPCALGFGCALLFTASTHLPQIHAMPLEQGVLFAPDLLAACAAVVACALYARNRIRLSSSAWAVACIGVAGMCSAFAQFFVPEVLPELVQGVVPFAAKTLHRLVFLALALCWGELLAQAGELARPAALRLVACALFVCGGMEVVLASMVPAAARGLTLALAPVSALCIASARSRLAFAQELGVYPQAARSTTETPYIPGAGRAGASRHPFAPARPAAVFFAMTVLLLANHSWFLNQDMLSSAGLIQVASGAGVLCAGLLYLACYRWWRRGRIRELAMATLISVAAIGLYLTTFLDMQWAPVYVLLLKVGECLCIFLALPDGPDAANRQTARLAACLAAYSLARAAAIEMSVVFGDMLTGLLVPLVVIVVVLALTFGAAFLTPRSPAEEHGTPTDSHAPDITILDGFGLSDRELQIAGLLVEGRTSAYIAESIGLAHSTVRNYISNIYAKLGIHSKQDLLDMVHHL